MHQEGKTYEQIRAVFNISRSRVGQIILAHKETLAVQQDTERKDDPLTQAYTADRISTRFYRKLIRAGYGKTFSFEQLCIWCQTEDRKQLLQLRAFGEANLGILRRLCAAHSTTKNEKNLENTAATQEF